MTISQALIFAAGEARRMRPLTDTLPKPLLKVGDNPLLTHIIDHLVDAGVNRIIINGHHALAPLKTYMATLDQTYPDCKFFLSEEQELMDTGGGAVKALSYLDENQPLYMINGDAYWMNDHRKKTLQSLAERWAQLDNPKLLLLLQPTASMAITGSVGDYKMENGKASRCKNKDGNYMFTGIRVCSPRLLQNREIAKYSFLKMMDEEDGENRLFGLEHKGEWYHISTPADLDEVNRELFGMVS
jgi:MurNAc alpha-1-phosphate uridylyltransferase